MNVAELYLQTAHLGFETTLEDSDRFYFAANRALLQVCKVRPAIRHCVINHKPLVNLIRENTFSPIEKTDDITFEAEDAKAYYFESDGNGVLYLEKYNSDTEEWSIFGEIPLQSNQTFVSYKGFIKKQGEFVSGRIRLRFTGEYLYSIKNVALYQYLYSGEAADIPAYAAYTRYDVKKLVSDFMALCCPPIKEEEENTLLNQEYEQEGDSIILLPYNVVKLSLNSENQTAVLSSNSPEVGNIEEELQFDKLTGNDIEISFNPDYMKAALQAFGQAEVKLSLTLPLRPFTLMPTEDSEDFIQLITPVRTY